MKRLILLAMLLMGVSVFAQYEDEIKMLNQACETPVEQLDSLFDGFECQINKGFCLCADYENDKYYTVDFDGDKVFVSYVENYNRENFKAMKTSIKTASKDYHYIVTSFREGDTILITSTKK